MERRPVEETTKAEPERKPFRAQTLLALLLCGGALYWAYRTTKDGMRPVNHWAKQIRSSDAEERQAAARQLGDSDEVDLEIALPALLAAMDDQETVVRAEAASGLGTATVTAMKKPERQAEVKEAARVLTRALVDPDSEVRTSAAYALGQIAEESKGREFPADPASVASAMVGLLSDPSIMIRDTAGRSIALVAGKAPLEPPPALVEGLGKWPLKESREAAALALGSFRAGVAPTVAALTRALDDKEPEVRSAAAVSLRLFGADAAGAIPSLVKNLGDPYVPPQVPRFAVMKMGSRADGGLGATAVDDGDDNSTDPAMQAARAIGLIGQAQVQKGTNPGDDVVEALTRALHSDRQALRDAASAALRRIGKGASAAIPGLIRELVDSTSKEGPGFGPTAAVALGDIAPGTDRAGEAIASLASAIDANDPEIRTAAVEALGKFGSAASAALPRLREIAEGKDPDAGLVAAVRTASDRIEGKISPESSRRKGRGRGRGGPGRN